MSPVHGMNTHLTQLQGASTNNLYTIEPQSRPMTRPMMNLMYVTAFKPRDLYIPFAAFHMPRVHLCVRSPGWWCRAIRRKYIWLSSALHVLLEFRTRTMRCLDTCKGPGTERICLMVWRGLCGALVVIANSRCSGPYSRSSIASACCSSSRGRAVAWNKRAVAQGHNWLAGLANSSNGNIWILWRVGFWWEAICFVCESKLFLHVSLSTCFEAWECCETQKTCCLVAWKCSFWKALSHWTSCLAVLDWYVAVYLAIGYFWRPPRQLMCRLCKRKACQTYWHRPSM